MSNNTILPMNVINAGITDPETNIPGVPQVTEVEMRREVERISVAMDYDFANDYSLGFVYGKNEQNTNWIRDFDLTDRVAWFSRDPQSMEDESFELRLTSPQDGRLRWLLGVNRYEQEFSTSGGGGDATTSCFSFLGGPTDPLTDDLATCIPGLVLLFRNSLQNVDRADVLGFFAAVDIDLTDQITISLEGRQQDDELTKGAGVLTPGAPVLTDSFDKFLPRVIGRWQPSETTNVFVSYSVGQIAGDFNTFFINADDRERAQYLALDSTVAESTPAEELIAYELGWKQIWFDGRLQTNLAIYQNEWTGIKGRSSFLINETCDAGDIDNDEACQSANGPGAGDPKQIPNPAGGGGLVPFFNSRNILIPGDADITGIELESWWRPSDTFTMTLNLSHIDSEYTDYRFNFVAPIAGYSQMRGNATPRQPKWSGNATATQLFDVKGVESYLRGEVIYQGRAFVDESNLAYIDPYALINLRAGFNTERWHVEAFIKNVADEDAWATGARWTDFSSPTQFRFLVAKQGVAVSPQDRREVGIRATMRFGNNR